MIEGISIPFDPSGIYGSLGYRGYHGWTPVTGNHGNHSPCPFIPSAKKAAPARRAEHRIYGPLVVAPGSRRREVNYI